MIESYANYVNSALDLLDEGLHVYVETRMQIVRGKEWRSYVPQNVEISEGAVHWDTQAILVTMLNQWHDVFHTELGFSGKNYVGELKDWRNKVAHRSAQKPIEADDAYRAVDTVWRLLRLVPLPQARVVHVIKDELKSQDRGSLTHHASAQPQSAQPQSAQPQSAQPQSAQGQYTIKMVKATPTLYHLRIYEGDVHIGDYERSGDGTYAEKSEEALQAADYLKGYYLEYGCKFAVRWYIDRKEIREYQVNKSDPGSKSRVLGTIPERYWRKR